MTDKAKKPVDKSFLVKITPRDTYHCDIHGVALQRFRSGFDGNVWVESKKGIVEVDPMQLMGVLAGLLVGFVIIPYAMARTVLFGLNRWWFNSAMRVVMKKKGRWSAFRAWLFRKL
jgi:hypothetical protein